MARTGRIAPIRAWQRQARTRRCRHREVTEHARRLGANAVVGVNLDYEVLGDNGARANGHRERNGGTRGGNSLAGR